VLTRRRRTDAEALVRPRAVEPEENSLNPYVVILAFLVGAILVSSFSMAVIKGSIPVWLHILTTFLWQFVGVSVGLYAYYSLHVPDKLEPYFTALPQGVQKFASIGLFLLATTIFMMIPLWIYARLITVRCRKQGCGGRAYLINIHPYTYKCRLCGEIYETKVSQTGRR
jgi:hypothetical protein